MSNSREHKVVEKTKAEFTIRRRYSISPPTTFQWFERTIAHIKSSCDPIISFHASCELRTDYRDHINMETLEDWVDYIQQHWSEMATSWAWLSSDNYRLSFHCDYKESSVELEVASASIEDCSTILTKLGEDLQLAPIAEVDERKVHERSAVKIRFFATLPLIQWFEEFIHYITSSWAPLNNFYGSYDLRSYFYGTRVRVEILKEWIGQIKQNWSEVAESNAWFSSDNRQLSFHCDHRRSLIDLEVQSPSIKTSNDMLTVMEKHLNLAQVQEDPYRYRKSFATYKVGDWKRKNFVDKTRELITGTFNGQEPAVRDAFVTKVLDDNIQRLQGFYSVNAFLTFIEESDEADFEWASMTVEGASGLAIGISLSKKDKRLEFRSNIEPNELEEKVVKFYKKPLQLKLIKGESTGSAITSHTEPKAEKWWVKYAFQVIVAVLGTAAIVVTLARAYLTEYDLKITNPIKSPAEVNLPDVPLAWYLWPKDSFIHGPDYQAAASILIIHKGVTVRKFENTTPPFPVQLKNGEGDYIIEIRPQRKAQPVRVVITYKTQTADTK